MRSRDRSNLCRATAFTRHCISLAIAKVETLLESRKDSTGKSLQLPDYLCVDKKIPILATRRIVDYAPKKSIITNKKSTIMLMTGNSSSFSVYQILVLGHLGHNLYDMCTQQYYKNPYTTLQRFYSRYLKTILIHR